MNLNRFRKENGGLGCVICGIGWPGWLVRWHLKRQAR